MRKYNNSQLKNNEDMINIINKLSLDADSLSFHAYYHPDAPIYQTTLTLELHDKNDFYTVKIGIYDMSTMIKNLGNDLIGQNFSKEFIQILDEYIYDKYHQ